MGDASALDASTVKPRTFAELKEVANATITCQRCGQRPATHSLSMTAAKLGSARAIEAMLRKVPVCEPCGVEVFALFKRALKQ